MTGNYVFEQTNNADWVQPLTLNSYNQSTNTRVLLNLAGVEVKLLLEGTAPGQPTLLLSTINGMLIIPSGADLGELIIQVPAASMWTLQAGTYLGDCLLFMPGGDIIQAFSLRLTIDAGITPPTP